MSDDNTFLNKLRKGGSALSEDDVMMAVSEDKRLVALGIDPSGDPIDIMMQVRAKFKALREKPEDS